MTDDVQSVVSISALGGNCPVQGVGEIAGQPFYFRARGDSWSLAIGGEIYGEADWSYSEAYGDGPFDAGSMTYDEAKDFIHKGARIFLAQLLRAII